jgi:hypothetical protein
VSEKRFRLQQREIQLCRALFSAHLREKAGPLRDSGQYATTGLASELRPARLANAGAQETSVIFHAYLAAGQKIRHCCNRF